MRTAFRQAMRIMGQQFVMGRDIGEALARSADGRGARYRYTYDMLGESALTEPDALRYLDSYRAAIEAVGRSVRPGTPPAGWPSISVKLSALHPRYEYRPASARCSRSSGRASSRSRSRAKDVGIALTIDAEEADRLELSLVPARPAAAMRRRSPAGTASGSRCRRIRSARRTCCATCGGAPMQAGRALDVRLVKGAYWDSEVKRAQERGLPGYPVYTRKANTDVAYLACARILLEGSGASIRSSRPTTRTRRRASSTSHAARGREFEFQRLHGMGEELYAELTDPAGRALPCRVYAPVGSHEDLLPYLVRRLLENGANTSFVNRIVDESLPVEARGRRSGRRRRARRRRTASAHSRCRARCSGASAELRGHQSRGRARAARAGRRVAARRSPRRCVARADRRRARGAGPRAPVRVARGHRARASATSAEADAALADRGDRPRGRPRNPTGIAMPAATRGAILREAADRLEARLRALRRRCCVAEAGKTVPDAIAEVREAVDFLRYYAARAEESFGRPLALPGPTGESQPARPARPRRVRLHQPVEFPARDLHRPGDGRARRRQCGGRETGGADAAGRGRDGAAAARGRRPGRRAAFPAGTRLEDRPGADRRPAHRRRRLHRLDRHRAAHQPQPRRARRPAAGADRRDRRPERDDRRQLGAAGAGRATTR